MTRSDRPVTPPHDPLEAAIAAVRAICMALPEAWEEAAWRGIRWKIRSRTFAHVLEIDEGRPRGHAKVARTDGPAVVVVFRSGGEELEALTNAGHPYFAASWGRDDAGMVLEAPVDWAEVGELLTESYCLLAPKGLAADVARPAP